MTVFNILPAAASTKYSWVQLAAIGASLLLATVGGKASAAVDCAAKTVNHTTSAQCLAHRPHAGVHNVSKTPVTIGVTEGDVLTPISATAVKTVAAHPRAVAAAAPAANVKLPDIALPASALVARAGHAAHGPSPWSSHGAPAGNRLPLAAGGLPIAQPVTAAMPTSDATPFHDLVRTGGDRFSIVPAPAAGVILLAGLLGLTALIRSPRVARVGSWAMPTLSSADGPRARAKARGWAVDRVDPERYATAQVGRSHKGHFVRTAGARFGAEAI